MSAPFIPIIHDDPTVRDLVADLRTGALESYYATESEGLPLILGTDVNAVLLFRSVPGTYPAQADASTTARLTLFPRGNFNAPPLAQFSATLGTPSDPSVLISTFAADATLDKIATTSAHYLQPGDYVRFTVTGGSLPAPLVNTNYYAVHAVLSSTAFTLDDGAGGILDLTTAGSGTRSVYRTNAGGFDLKPYPFPFRLDSAPLRRVFAAINAPAEGNANTAGLACSAVLEYVASGSVERTRPLDVTVLQ